MKFRKRVLVSGGAGYIGSHTAKMLYQNGFDPIVLYNLVTGHKNAVKWGKLIKGEISDSELVKTIITDYGIKSVIHFAAFAYVGESVENPRRYFDNNIVSSIKFINSIIDSEVDNFIFSSSCAIYGIPHKLPISEDHPKNPINPYGISKFIIEKF